MSCLDIKSQWGGLVGQLSLRFPELASVELRAIGGDPGALARLLAKAHDLTTAEATEALEDWRLLAAGGQRI